MNSTDPKLILGDIIVEKMHIHYGLQDKNPVGRIRFFDKVFIYYSISSMYPYFFYIVYYDLNLSISDNNFAVIRYVLLV